MTSDASALLSSAMLSSSADAWAVRARRRLGDHQWLAGRQPVIGNGRDVGDACVSEVPLPAITPAIDEVPVADLRQQSSDRLVGSAMLGRGVSGTRMRPIDHPDCGIGK